METIFVCLAKGFIETEQILDTAFIVCFVLGFSLLYFLDHLLKWAAVVEDLAMQRNFRLVICPCSTVSLM